MKTTMNLITVLLSKPSNKLPFITTSRSTTTVKTTLKPVTTQKKKVLLQKTKEPSLVKTLPPKPKVETV